MDGELWKTCDALAPPLLNPLRAVLVMLAVVYLPHAIRAPLVIACKGGYNNVNPRDQMEKVQSTALSRMIKRATAAHQNNWEAFSYFAASAITAHICKVDIEVASSLCTLFIALRVAFTLFYLVGVNDVIALCRSLTCVAGLVVSVRLTLLALEKQGL